MRRIFYVAALISSSAQAGWGPTPQWCQRDLATCYEFFGGNIPPRFLEPLPVPPPEAFVGKAFCRDVGGYQHVLRFLPDGEFRYEDPLAGAPNPREILKWQSDRQGGVVILRYIDGLLTGTASHYHWQKQRGWNPWYLMFDQDVGGGAYTSEECS